MRPRRRFPRPILNMTTPTQTFTVKTSERKNAEPILDWKTDKGITHLEFDSLADFVAKIESLPAEYYYRSNIDGGRWQFGAYENEETSHAAIKSGLVMDRTRQKYFDTLAKLEPVIEKFANQDGLSTRRKRVFSDSDGELNLDRYLDQKDELWESTTRAQKRRLVSLGVNFWLSCFNNEADFIGIAAIAAAAADVLTRLGYATEVKLCSICEVGGSQTVTSFIVKAADEPLDVQNILQIANPGLLRSLYFKLHTDIHPHDGSKGHGVPHTKETKEVIGVDYLITKEWTDGRDSQELVIEGMLTDIQIGDFTTEQVVPQYLR